MLGRLFLILVLLAVSLYVVKYLRIKWDEQQNKNKEASKFNDTSDSQQQSKKLMLKCQHCGLHIPEKEAIKQGDNIFCCLEHAKMGL